MQSEKLEYDNKIILLSNYFFFILFFNYGKLMPRRAENFGMPTDYRRNPRTSVWFPSVVACYLFWKMPIFLIPLGFGFFFAKRNKVQTHPPTLPSPLRILIVPVTAAKRNRWSMQLAIFHHKINAVFHFHRECGADTNWISSRHWILSLRSVSDCNHNTFMIFGDRRVDYVWWQSSWSSQLRLFKT